MIKQLRRKWAKTPVAFVLALCLLVLMVGLALAGELIDNGTALPGCTAVIIEKHGDNSNVVEADAAGATISGGGFNLVTKAGSCGTIGGGLRNAVAGNFGTVSGGLDNEAATVATIAGGRRNRATAEGSTIAGGCGNVTGDGHIDDTACRGSKGETSLPVYSTVGGGVRNLARGETSTVAGGGDNVAAVEGTSIGGGIRNHAEGLAADIAGGYSNTVTGRGAFIGGGWGNLVSADGATIAGGGFLDIHNLRDTPGGNKVTGAFGTVGGGSNNQVNGIYGVVPGGRFNVAGGKFSFAAGRNAIAKHDGAFVWADCDHCSTNSAPDFESRGINEFAVRATGGVRIVSAIDKNGNPKAGVVLHPGGGAWSVLSDRALKDNLAAVDSRQILGRLASVPIQTWNLQTQDPSIRHIGPTAQDFYAAFGMGEDDTHINSVDADGVALAAIQGLYQLAQEQNAQIALVTQQVNALQSENKALRTEMEQLRLRMAVIEARTSGTAWTAETGLLADGRVWAVTFVAMLGLLTHRRRDLESRTGAEV